MIKKSRVGFVLLIVIGMLAALSMLAISVAGKSGNALALQRQAMLRTRAALLASSGYETGKSQIFQYVEFDLDQPFRVKGNSKIKMSLPDGAVTVDVADTAGKINVNDGILAGKKELGSNYVSNAIDPRPETSPGSGDYVVDVSGFINLRIRRLLNSYGDAHKFVSQHGWPVWKRADFSGAFPYGEPFVHSSTDVGSRNQSLPGKDSAGNPLVNLADIAASSTGLGDRLIASRPASGFSNMAQMKIVLDKWAQDLSIPATYWNSLAFDSFSAMTTEDLTVSSYLDEKFFRISREFGADNDADGFIDYNNNQSDPLVNTIAMTSNPPDLSNLWIEHPSAVINLNECAPLVRAAIFYAPVNISLSCEGIEVYRDVASNTQAEPFNFGEPTLGIGGVVINPSNLRENGNSSSRQVGRLLSLRDSLNLAQAYEEYSANHPVLSWPDNFSDFGRFLKIVTVDSSTFAVADYEVAASKTGLLRHRIQLTTTNGAWSTVGAASPIYFHEEMLADIFPHVFSPYRRLPSWMHAPIALLSPLCQQGNRGALKGRVLRSAEDFVSRSTLPKINFHSSGCFRINSLGTQITPNSKISASISAVVKIFEVKNLRSQKDFYEYRHSSTDAQIAIGPDPHDVGTMTSVEKNSYLGVVGLKDRVEDVSQLGSGWSHSCRLSFSHDDPFSVEVAPGSTPFSPQDPAIDAYLSTDQLGLANSELEGNDISIFEAGNAGSDLSIFGGVSLGSRGHGVGSIDQFADSLYWRPYGASGVINSGETPGDKFNKGLISLWMRIPSGYYWDRSLPLLQLNLWEKVEVHDYHYYAFPWPNSHNPEVVNPPSVRVETRPVTLTLSYEPQRPANYGPAPWLGFDYKSPGNFFSFTQSKGRQQVGGDPLTGNGFMTSLPWGGDISLPTLSYPPPSGPFPDNVLGAMYPTTAPGATWFIAWPELCNETLTSVSQYHWMYKKGTPNILIGNGTNHVNTKEDVRATGTWPAFTRKPGDVGMCASGTWQRVICAWDFSQFPTRHNERMWISVPTAKSSYANFEPRGGWQSQNTVTRNPKMVMSLGEQHSYWASGSSYSTYSVVPSADSFFVKGRMNSLIDNVDVLFGSTGPFSNQSDLDQLDSTASLSGFHTKRYDLTVEGDPFSGTPNALKRTYVVDPKLVAGSKMLMLSTRIYDVPNLNLPGQDLYNAPEVTIDVDDGSVVSPRYESHVCAFQSRSVKCYSGIQTSNGTVFNISWRSEDPSGNPVKARLNNIPWLKEVSWRYTPATGAKVVSFVRN